MKLVLFKNIRNKPSYGQKWCARPYMDIRYLGIRFSILGPIRLTFFMGALETIIYRLVLRNPSSDAYFLFFYFWATFGGKMGDGRGHHVRP